VKPVNDQGLIPGGSVDRLSRLFLRTLRESPAGADAPGQQLLVRAGYLRRTAPGFYSWLPLGLRVVRKLERIIREEITRLGGQEVVLPGLPGRPQGELVAQLVKDVGSSYKSLPLILFQFRTGLREEARARGGIVEGRECRAMDSYSFDLDQPGLERAYLAHRTACQEMLDRLSLTYRLVSASSGAVDQRASEKFLAPAGSGEDIFVTCPSCGYAATSDAAVFAGPSPEDPHAHPPMEELDTPDTPTIEALARRVGVEPAETLKNVVVKVAGRPALVLVPGDRDADLDRLRTALGGAGVELFTPEDFQAHPELVRGYVGPQQARERGLVVFADRRVAVGTSWVTGANALDTHARNVVSGRDFTVDRYLDVAPVRAGDPCCNCQASLQVEQAIEVGRLVRLGRRYSDAVALDAAGADGKSHRVAMGSYRIGVTGLVAALAEQRHDDAGLCWPVAVAPAHIHVVVAGRSEDLVGPAEQLSSTLATGGWHLLLDDRGVAPGVAFADADLLGVPVQLIVGRALARGRVELKWRPTGERQQVPVARVRDAVAALIGPPI
jgi:prolyl-tRNA synthetase